MSNDINFGGRNDKEIRFGRKARNIFYSTDYTLLIVRCKVFHELCSLKHNRF